MNARKLQRTKMKSALAQVKERWKAYAKKEREEKRAPMTFETWLGIDERKRK